MRLEFKCDQNVLGYHDIEVDKLPLLGLKESRLYLTRVSCILSILFEPTTIFL